MAQVGAPVRFVIEVGPVTYHNYSRADRRRAIAKTRKTMDEAVRRYWQVGPRCKSVRSRVEEVD